MLTVSTSFLLILYVTTARSRSRAMHLIQDPAVETEHDIVLLARYIADLTSLKSAIDDMADDLELAQDGNVEIDYDVQALVDLCADAEGEIKKISTISIELH
jgi:hypothetical protein